MNNNIIEKLKNVKVEYINYINENNFDGYTIDVTYENSMLPYVTRWYDVNDNIICIHGNSTMSELNTYLENEYHKQLLKEYELKYNNKGSVK